MAEFTSYIIPFCPGGELLILQGSIQKPEWLCFTFC
jgi:hypothetical protein